MYLIRINSVLLLVLISFCFQTEFINADTVVDNGNRLACINAYKQNVDLHTLAYAQCSGHMDAMLTTCVSDFVNNPPSNTMAQLQKEAEQHCGGSIGMAELMLQQEQGEEVNREAQNECADPLEDDCGETQKQLCTNDDHVAAGATNSAGHVCKVKDDGSYGFIDPNADTRKDAEPPPCTSSDVAEKREWHRPGERGGKLVCLSEGRWTLVCGPNNEPAQNETQQCDGTQWQTTSNGETQERVISDEPSGAGGDGSNVGQGQPCAISSYLQSQGAPAQGVSQPAGGGFMACVDPAGRVQTLASQLEAELSGAQSACETAGNDANNCCNNPLACVTGGSEQADSTLKDIVGFGGSLAMQILGSQAGTSAGTKKLCDFMNAAGTATAGLNAAGAGTCLAGKSTCNGKCGSGQNRVEQILRQCGAPGGSFSQAAYDECSLLLDVATNYTGVFNPVIASCDQLNEQVAMQAMQAVSSQQGAQFAQQCADAATQEFSTGDVAETVNFETDCSDPANAGSPYCLECSGPSAANNPFCQNPALLNQGTSGGIAQTPESTFGDGDELAGAALDAGPEGIDQTSFGNPVLSQTRSNGVQGGGGAGGAPGGQGGAPGLDGGGGGGSGVGHNADVLRGVSGGGGYSAPSVSRVGVSTKGGFGGYGRAGKRKTAGSKFDLKQFLPGGKKDPRKRGIAGVAGAKAAIGRKEENIFHKMAKKYKQMCRLKRMWDCPSLGKTSK